MNLVFRNLCVECNAIKKRKKTTGLTCKPILSMTFNSRAEVDLSDMQTCPDSEYKWLLVYQDYFTKFVQLRHIKSKSSDQVANALLDIFTFRQYRESQWRYQGYVSGLDARKLLFKMVNWL